MRDPSPTLFQTPLSWKERSLVPSAGRGLFELLIAEVTYDIASLPPCPEREELEVALVGLNKKLESLQAS